MFKFQLSNQIFYFYISLLQPFLILPFLILQHLLLLYMCFTILLLLCQVFLDFSQIYQSRVIFWLKRNLTLEFFRKFRHFLFLILHVIPSNILSLVVKFLHLGVPETIKPIKFS